MSGPETGKYWIRLVADPKPFVGVEPVPVPVKPVVTAARDNIVSPHVYVQRQRHLCYPFNSQSSFFMWWSHLLIGPFLSLLQWTVTKLDDGNYTLILEESGTPLFIQDDEGKLVGSEEPPPFHWNIRGEDGGPYTLVPVCPSLYVIPDIQTKIWQNRGTQRH